MSHKPSPTRTLITVVLVLLCGLTAVLLVTVTFGFSSEYADTGADAVSLAASTLGDWAIFLMVPGAFALVAVAVARRSARLHVTAVTTLILAITAAGIAGSGVLGAAAKYERYPSLPNCTDEFTGGPAYPVVHAAQDAYDELDHPGPFSGGENSGLDGCQTQLMVRGDVDPVEVYRAELEGHGWRITDAASGETLQAVRGDEAFVLTHGEYGDWTVWIGPRGLPQRQLDEGQVGPGAR